MTNLSMFDAACGSMCLFGLEKDQSTSVLQVRLCESLMKISLGANLQLSGGARKQGGTSALYKHGR